MNTLEIVVLTVGLAVLVPRCCEVAQSPCGLWTEFPHSGFCPDSPNAERSELSIGHY